MSDSGDLPSFNKLLAPASLSLLQAFMRNFLALQPPQRSPGSPRASPDEYFESPPTYQPAIASPNFTTCSSKDRQIPEIQLKTKCMNCGYCFSIELPPWINRALQEPGHEQPPPRSDMNVDKREKLVSIAVQFAIFVRDSGLPSLAYGIMLAWFNLGIYLNNRFNILQNIGMLLLMLLNWAAEVERDHRLLERLATGLSICWEAGIKGAQALVSDQRDFTEAQRLSVSTNDELYHNQSQIRWDYIHTTGPSASPNKPRARLLSLPTPLSAEPSHSNSKISKSGTSTPQKRRGFVEGEDIRVNVFPPSSYLASPVRLSSRTSEFYEGDVSGSPANWSGWADRMKNGFGL